MWNKRQRAPDETKSSVVERTDHEHTHSIHESRNNLMTRLTLFPLLLGGRLPQVFLSLGLIALSACDTGSKDRAAKDRVPPPPPATAPRPRDTVAGASRLQWTLANLEEALRKNRLNPVRGGRVRQPFLGGEGVLYQIGQAELQVYLYADAGAVARDTDPLDTTRVAPPTMQVSWRMPPTLIVDNNMAAILLTRDDSLRRKIRAAIEKSHRD